MNIAGTWALVSFVVESDTGTTHPYGEDAFGRLLYDREGWMSAVLMTRPRSAGSRSLEGARHASTEDKAQAFDEYLSYTGRWSAETLNGETWIAHHVDASLVPAVIGTTLRRRARVDGDQLVLDYETRSSSGRKRRFVLRWRRG